MSTRETFIPATDGLSAEAAAMVVFSAPPSVQATEPRAILRTRDGRVEDVASHSHMLSVVASEWAATYYPLLDANLVARFGSVHDLLEAYVGDTPTHIIDNAGLVAKAAREDNALVRFECDYARFPSFVRIMKLYHAQEVPEARFVRIVDKLTPLLVYINDDCDGLLHDGETPENIRAYARAKVERLQPQYPEYNQLFEILLELAEFVANRLAQRLQADDTARY